MAIPKKAIEFLVRNRLENSREWYAAHRDDYRRYVLEPMQRLVTELAPTMLSIDDQLICEPKVDRSISRIYRDTRFVRNKSLYRDNVWCLFTRDKRIYHGPPSFYFEFSPRGYSWGCGYYVADTESMQQIRKLILDGDAAFAEALAAYEGQTEFAIEGEPFKRPRHPGAPPNLREWLDRKQLGFSHDGGADKALLFSDALGARIAQGFQTIAPIYRFLMRAESFRPHDAQQ